MKKLKVFALILVAVLTLGFFACKKDEPKQPTEETPAKTQEKTPSEVTPVNPTTPAPTYDMTGAVNYLKNMYFNLEGSETPGDFEVIAQLLVKGDKFTIEWSVELPEESEDVVVVPEETKAKIDVNEKAASNVSYVLVAKITAPDKSTAELKFNLTLPKYNLMSWEEYMAAEKESSIVISGVATGKVWANATAANIYLEDEDGGYYVYAFTCDQAKFDEIEIGATYEVSGIKDDYYGTAEIKNAALTKLDNPKVTPEPKDITEAWLAAADTKDSKLVSLLAQYVKITGVEMVSITNDGKYINFKRADGMTSYVYISSSSNFVTADEITQLNEKCIGGRLADITGFVFLYNGAFYIIPDTVDSITLQALPELSDAEKVAAAAEEVGKLDKTTVESDLELPKPAYDSVSFVWESSNAELLDNAGKIVAYPLEATEVKFTCTITSGEESQTVELTLTVAALTKTNIADLDWSDAESTFIIEGKVIGADKYTDFYVADTTGVVYVYTKLPEGVAVGDSVKVVGKLLVYGIDRNQATKEFVPATITKLDTAAEILEPVKLDLADLCAVVYADGKFTDGGAKVLASRLQGGLYEITGYVRVKTSGTYTNVYIATENTDEAPCVIYNYTNNADDIAKVQALEGKLVTLIAPIHDYYGSYGWRIGPHTNDLAEVEAAPEIAKGTHTCAELYDVEKDADVEIVGTVLHAYKGNGFVLHDGTAGIYVYDKTCPTFNIGDVVRVTGKKDAYNGIAEVVKPTAYKVEKIQPNYELVAQEMTLDQFLALDGTDRNNFGIAIKMEGTLVVGSYINLKTGEGTTTNLYLSADEKAAVLAMVPEGVTEIPVEGIFITYQFKNAFYVFIDVPTMTVKLGE